MSENFSTGPYYDCHTLYVKTEGATHQQIHDCFRAGIEQYARSTAEKIPCSFRVNLVENREGQPLGIAFVFITEPKIFYLLLGKNPDGTERVKYQDDPTWQPAPSAPVAASSSWADILEEEAVQVPRQIAISLDPLIVLPSITLTPEQYAERRNKIYQEHPYPELVKISTQINLSLDRAFVLPLDQKLMPHILKAKNIPAWVTKEQLKMHFRPYASDSVTRQEKYLKGKKIQDTYPFVNINSERVAFIIFDQSTHDAQFALHMMKKLPLTHPTQPDKNTLLFFSHSYRTGRDEQSSYSTARGNHKDRTRSKRH